MFDELSLHLLDVAMNSLAAGARTVRLTVIDHPRRDRLTLRVQDDGQGMDPATLGRVMAAPVSTKPHRPKPIGLGLALLRQAAEMCNGKFRVRSQKGHGTTVTAVFQRSHVDRPPLGDLKTTIQALCAAHPAGEIQLRYLSEGEEFRFSSQESARRPDSTGPAASVPPNVPLTRSDSESRSACAVPPTSPPSRTPGQSSPTTAGQGHFHINLLIPYEPRRTQTVKSQSATAGCPA